MIPLHSSPASNRCKSIHCNAAILHKLFRSIGVCQIMNEFSDCLLIKIFQLLEVQDLIRCCKVCTKWKRVVYDGSLWTNVDLRPFRWKLDEQCIVRLTQTRFRPYLRRLNLSGFSLTPKLFNCLQSDCPNLISLILENVSFIGFNAMDTSLQMFPTTLEFLDLRYSTGDEEAFDLIATNVKLLKCFGLSNHMLSQTNHVGLFRNLKNITVLDFSYCNSLHDATLILIANFCTNLCSLSLIHCNNVSGKDLHLITRHCKHLKALSFSGTSLTDENLSSCEWDNIALEELDVSWCRNITEAGLLLVLPCLPHMVYLRLCSCGFGHAITDRVLQIFSKNSYRRLESIDIR